MLKQRLGNRSSPLAFAAPAVVVLFSLLLIWGGAVVLLLALKLDPDSVQAVTGYQTVYDFLRGLASEDFDSTTRLIIAAAGLVLLLICGYLAYTMLPRPYLTRRDLDLVHDSRGEVVVEPLAIERLGETAAERRAGIAAARSRYGVDSLAVDVTIGHTRDLARSLVGVRGAVRDALDEHGLPMLPVDVTLTGYQPKARRELD